MEAGVVPCADLAGLAAASVEQRDRQEDQSNGLGLVECLEKIAGSAVALPAAGRRTVVTTPR